MLTNNNSTGNELVFLNTKQVAQILGCSIPTAREIMYSKDFPLIKIGRNLRVSKTALEKWSMERRVKF